MRSWRCAMRGAFPVVEDAAHSLGTVWNGRNIGTIGKVGCFSFQSYKMVNAGEGGILITDDPEIAARAVIMSGAYEHNWKKHPGLQNSYMLWQNKLPLYNMRMQNLSAAVIRPQLPEVARRVAQGRANHDHVAARLNAMLIGCKCRNRLHPRCARRIPSSSIWWVSKPMHRPAPIRRRPKRAAFRCRSSA